MAPSTAGRPRGAGKDNRYAILEAARDLFADSADVAMYQVGRRAGVGQATLYRHFPNRSAIVAELLDEHVERIAALAADIEGDPDAFFVLLRSIVDKMARLFVLARLASEDASVDAHLKRNRHRIAELLKRPLSDAKCAGTVRRGIGINDVFLVLAMTRGAMEGADGWASRSAVGHRSMALVLDGLLSP